MCLPRSCSSTAVACRLHGSHTKAAREHANVYNFDGPQHTCFLQWQAFRQLRRCQDLGVGDHGDGSHSHCFPGRMPHTGMWHHAQYCCCYGEQGYMPQQLRSAAGSLSAHLVCGGRCVFVRKWTIIIILYLKQMLLSLSSELLQR